MDSVSENIQFLLEKINLLELKINKIQSSFLSSNYLPQPPFNENNNNDFMKCFTCSASDFFHPKFNEICNKLKIPFGFHRKLWEWVFIIHHLEKNNILQEGKKGLVFGVGTERLPSLFANMGASIVATDAPPEIGDAWKGGDQFSENLSGLYFKDLVDYQNFERRVSYKTCDMNNIDEEFINFDFNWSSCCFEHLGSLENGMNFVINSVEKTLKQNGIAVHTTEFNLSSNNETLETGHTVIYRRRDIEELVNRLERRGHSVQSFVIAPDSHPLDFHVDIPPYIHAPHIRLMYEKYIVTSVGLVIKRGRV